MNDANDANETIDTARAISASNVNMKGWCYPAVFHQEAEGGYWVSFPDFPECLTQGSDISEAVLLSSDALSLAISSSLEAGEAVPPPFASTLVSEDGTSFVASVEALIPSSKAPQVY